ncbi:Glycoprotein-N-acetylgalactosamine 3-beta-galactosyltransferase 1 [Orchesella cincta]|uniref:Glycoprotein-N-acetylgalactosamine 3-beta-galactosyltransferase 1 n=1 Tax=Orchesella cincta TaxID=48709 RepID=A0A1D2M1I9_ORCCI|nr:Glycoprotein-N-acetylgalactosamine 3-beta-galactosyltransferase 1 [Orchesella cincta]
MNNLNSATKEGFVLLAGLTIGLLAGYLTFSSINPRLPHLSVSKLLSSSNHKPRILCWVMTAPENHETRAIHVKRTWGKRCDKLLFMSTSSDSNLPAIKLDEAEEGIDNLWLKTKGAFRYIVEHHFDEADWFLKADDDTYVILENLRYFLNQHDTNLPLYFGCKFRLYIEQGYMSGGAGYVLSKEAVRRLARETSQEGNICDNNLIEYKGWIPEDVMLGKCLESLKVPAGDSRDEEGRHRFLALPPDMQFGPNPMVHWYWEYMYYQHEHGLKCCSDRTISFHYVTPNQMYALEFLLYRMKPVVELSHS